MGWTLTKPETFLFTKRLVFIRDSIHFVILLTSVLRPLHRDSDFSVQNLGEKYKHHFFSSCCLGAVCIYKKVFSWSKKVFTVCAGWEHLSPRQNKHLNAVSPQTLLTFSSTALQTWLCYTELHSGQSVDILNSNIGCTLRKDVLIPGKLFKYLSRCNLLDRK